MVNAIGELAPIPQSFLTVTDGPEDEYLLAKARKAVVPLINTDERWESQERNQLIQWVSETEIVQDEPTVFDIPGDSTGQKLVTEGTHETIDVGF